MKVTKNSYNNIEGLNILIICAKGYLLENVLATTDIYFTIALVSISDIIYRVKNSSKALCCF